MGKSLTQLRADNPINTFSGSELVELTKSGSSGAALLSGIKSFILTGLAGTSVSYTPTGGISATTVEAALTELDTDKVAKAGDTITGDLILTTGGATGFSLKRYSANGGGAILRLFKARGSIPAPRRTLNTDTIGSVVALGHEAADNVTNAAEASSSGNFRFIAAQDFTSTAHGTGFELTTTPLGSISTAVRFAVSSEGDIGSDLTTIIIDKDRNFRLRSYTVATLPTPGTAGRMAYASNLRVFNGTGTQEGAAAGTGGSVVDNGTAWKIAGTNVTAVA